MNVWRHLGILGNKQAPLVAVRALTLAMLSLMVAFLIVFQSSRLTRFVPSKTGGGSAAYLTISVISKHSDRGMNSTTVNSSGSTDRGISENLLAMDTSQQSTEVGRVRVELVARAAAEAASAPEPRGEDVSAVAVGCQTPCGTTGDACTNAAWAAVASLQRKLRHHVHVLVEEAVPLAACEAAAQRHEADLHHVHLFTLAERPSRGLYMAFIAIAKLSTSEPLVPAAGFLNILLCGTQVDVASALQSPKTHTYDIALMPDAEAAERFAALAAKRPNGTCVPTALELPASGGVSCALADLLVLYDVDLEPLTSLGGAHSNQWRFWLRVARDLQARRRVVCGARWDVPAISSGLVVYFETRPHATLETAAKQLLAGLGPHWGLTVLHGEANSRFVRSALADLGPMVRYLQLERLVVLDNDTQAVFDPRRGDAYNRMWKSPEFWQLIGAGVEHVVTFQADVFLPGVPFDPGWLEHSWVGAPWCNEGSNDGFVEPSSRSTNTKPFLHESRALKKHMRVGNGGFSLRAVQEIRAVAERCANETQSSENEDIFFVLGLHKNSQTDLGLGAAAPVAVAERFSLETVCADLDFAEAYTRERYWAPFGVHKPFNLARDFQVRTKGGSSFPLGVFDGLVRGAEGAWSRLSLI